jgi:LmbE family N-acetylglucosaminyl deacetylase
MSKSLKLLAVLAHPDDESMAMGGALAKYAAEGVETYLISATRGERGWFGPAEDYPGPEALGRIREAELYTAADVLGLQEVNFLDYMDGEVDQADPAEIIAKIVAHLRRIRPQVVLTFDPYGLYGHPDHIAISQYTSAAIVAAADPGYEVGTGLSHRVSKLYYRSFRAAEGAAYQAALGDLVMMIDGAKRRLSSWPSWAITTRLDTSAYWSQVWQAISCHRSQLPSYQVFEQLPAEFHQNLWGTQTYYRAFSFANGGRKIEDDLFSGIDEIVQPYLMQLPMLAR